MHESDRSFLQRKMGSCLCEVTYELQVGKHKKFAMSEAVTPRVKTTQSTIKVPSHTTRQLRCARKVAAKAKKADTLLTERRTLI